MEEQNPLMNTDMENDMDEDFLEDSSENNTHTSSKTETSLLQYAYRVIASKAHSELELKRKLLRRLEQYPAPDIHSDEDAQNLLERILFKMRDYHFVNDKAVAEGIARTRGWGERRKQQTMQRRGIDPATQKEALEDVDPDLEPSELARLVERNGQRWLAAGHRGYPRAYGFLLRRGFSPKQIGEALRPLMTQIEAQAKEQVEEQAEDQVEDSESEPTQKPARGWKQGSGLKRTGFKRRSS
jgi:regulatory protein